MRKIKIVSDSSSDLLMLDNVEFASSPMKIITAIREMVLVEVYTINNVMNFLKTAR